MIQLPTKLERTLALNGGWQVTLSGSGPQFPVHLPGSLDQAGIGRPNTKDNGLAGLSRKVTYTGPAVYSRTIGLPPQLRGVELELFLERVHWFTSVRIDGVEVGKGDSLSVPHCFCLAPTSARVLTIEIEVDNTPHIPIGRIGHAITDWTQTNWNGIIGRLELRAKPALSVSAASTSDGLRVFGTALPNQRVEIDQHILEADAEGRFEVLIDRSTLSAWSDDAPTLIELSVVAGESETKLRTGYRSFEAVGKRFHLNGKPCYLRGTLECCVFPRTGYPPTDVEAWLTVMRKIREYGLNHVRFHSWCPPEAAFAAADEVGLLLQVELPLWTGKWPLSSEPALLDFCRREAFRILDGYGHHPSFVLFTLGNEMAFYGQEPEVDRLLCELKSAFPHILFNWSSHGTCLSPESDYYVQADNAQMGEANRPLRGSTWFGVGSRFDREPPATTTTCDEAAAAYDRPVIAHEVGEWAVFPNVAAAPQFDGVLEARNFEWIRNSLAARGMEDQADSFTQASGKLSAELYKEEIETLLRTRGVAGFQLLGLNDFPGQGTATVGMLDCFWKEKGFIDGSTFRQFCAPTVPLMVTRKRVWSTGEPFVATVLALHSGGEVGAQATWEFLDDSGQRCAGGELTDARLQPGDPVPLGEIEFPLTGFSTGRYELSVELPGLGTNRWRHWVFAPTPEVEPGDVDVFTWYREDVRRALRAGRTVWLRMHPAKAWTGIPGRFATAFWSPIHFKEQVGTMGTLIAHEHPVFNHFPTQDHTEWHWWEILMNSKSFVLDALPTSFRPELQVIDRYERNHKLGTIFEACVGSGKLLVSFIDFDTPGRPAAAQLEYSLMRRLRDDFDPRQAITLEELDEVFSSEP